jgi:hypothetical protein
MTNIYRYLLDEGAAPRTTPALQQWMNTYVAQVAADAASWVFNSDTGDPTIPTDLDALWPAGGIQDEGSFVLWYNSTTAEYKVYFKIASTWVTLTTVNDAGLVAYIPNDGTDWLDPDPTTAEEALDDLALLTAQQRFLHQEDHFLVTFGDTISGGSVFTEIGASTVDNIYITVVAPTTVLEIELYTQGRFTVGGTRSSYLVGEWDGIAGSAPLQYPVNSNRVPDGGGGYYGNIVGIGVASQDFMMNFTARFEGLTIGNSYDFCLFAYQAGGGTTGLRPPSSVSFRTFGVVK